MNYASKAHEQQINMNKVRGNVGCQRTKMTTVVKINETKEDSNLNWQTDLYAFRKN